jgi:hypothetical protein
MAALKGMTGALAPFSYLVINIDLLLKFLSLLYNFGFVLIKGLIFLRPSIGIIFEAKT